MARKKGAAKPKVGSKKKVSKKVGKKTVKKSLEGAMGRGKGKKAGPPKMDSDGDYDR